MTMPRGGVPTPLRKFRRFVAMYGFERTLIKSIGRMRRLAPLGRFVQQIRFWKRGVPKDVAMIGCGQFAFSTCAYFLTRARGPCIKYALDPDAERARSLAYLFGAEVCLDYQAILDDPEIKYVWIVSNHASHTDYSVKALAAGKIVHVEKPVSVTHEQFAELSEAVGRSGADRIFCGYNRPHSAAIREIRQQIVDGGFTGGLTLACVVCGHVLDDDHWYRDPREGTRICGNMGHWLDLAVHLLFARDGHGPAAVDVTVAYADPSQCDEHVSIAIATERGDLISITFTARAEPFEGISESIVVQCGTLSARIDDFRSMTLHDGPDVSRRTYRPKDVGHRRAVLQPFDAARRNWEEVACSTRLMLAIADMVRERVRFARVTLDEAMAGAPLPDR